MKGISLYEIAGEYQLLFQQLAEQEDRDEQVVRDTLAHLQDQIEVKAINVAAYIKNLEAEAQAIKTAQDNLAQRQKRVNNRIAQLKSYLRDNLKRCGINKVHHPLFSISLVKTPPKLAINDVEQIPADYGCLQQTWILEEQKIKQALKNGTPVPGCELIQHETIRIR